MQLGVQNHLSIHFKYISVISTIFNKYFVKVYFFSQGQHEHSAQYLPVYFTEESQSRVKKKSQKSHKKREFFYFGGTVLLSNL